MGGALDQNRIITPEYGTSEGTVAEGNHQHPKYAVMKEGATQLNNVRVWNKIVVSASGGTWTADYSSEGFTHVVAVHVTGVATGQNDCTFASVASWTNTTATGYAKDSTSAGLLAAMEMINVVGRQIMVTVVGY